MIHRLVLVGFAAVLFVLFVFVPQRISTLKGTSAEISAPEALLISLSYVARSPLGTIVLIGALLIYLGLRAAPLRA